VLIRTVGLEQDGEGWRLGGRAGAGIVADSDPHAERLETEAKIAALQAALTEKTRMIPLDDRGLLLGDGLFETLLAVDGAIPAIEAHLDRMAAGCVTLGLPALDRDAARALCLAAPPRPRAAPPCA
jgi:23S rRNA A2030 N6-methylase RlmJ